MKYYILIETTIPSIFYTVSEDITRYFEIFVLSKKQKEALNEESLKSVILVEAYNQREALRIFNKKLDFTISKRADAQYYELYLPQV